MIRYPYCRPDIRDEDRAAAEAVLSSGWLTQGPAVRDFEAALAQTLGCRHAVVVNSGTAALHLAYHAIGLGPERGLLTSPVTFLATANAARLCGAPVAFADVDPATGNVTPETVEAALAASPHPIGAIAPVHLAGRPCDLADLAILAEAHGLDVIEDACHAPLARYPDGAGGTAAVGACVHSRAATLSFHAIKHIAAGEGGAILTNDDALADHVRIFRSHGMVRDAAAWQSPPEPDAPWYYEMDEPGWNYRLSDIHCAIGRSQLTRLAAGIAERAALSARYDELLGNHAWLGLPPAPEVPGGHSWHIYPIAIDFDALGLTRGQAMRRLAERGIGTQVHYIPLYHQPYYAREGHPPLPGVEAYYARTLSLPMYPGLSQAAVAEVADAVLSLAES